MKKFLTIAALLLLSVVAALAQRANPPGVPFQDQRGIYSDIDYLPIGQPDGTTNNTTALTNMSTVLCSKYSTNTNQNNGGTVLLRPMNYVVGDWAINCGLHLFGTYNLAYTGVTATAVGTKFTYDVATANGVLFSPVGFPAMHPDHWLEGVDVEGILFVRNTATTTPALRVQGGFGTHIHDIGVNGAGAYSGIVLYGGQVYNIDNVYMPAMANVGIYVIGDNAGQTPAGAACTTISVTCSTFTNVVTISRAVMGGNGTAGIGIILQGVVDTVEINGNSSFENGDTGLQVTCPAGFASAAWCPEFIVAYNFQTEFYNRRGFELSDFTDFQCFGCYATGNSVGDYALVAQMVNYSPSGGLGGGFRWIGGRIAGAAAACAYMAVSDVVIAKSWLWYCNQTGVANANPAINMISGARQIYEGNEFCTLLSGGAGTFYAVKNTGATKTIVVNNTYTGCTGLLQSGVLDVNANNIN